MLNVHLAGQYFSKWYCILNSHCFCGNFVTRTMRKCKRPLVNWVVKIVSLLWALHPLPLPHSASTIFSPSFIVFLHSHPPVPPSSSHIHHAPPPSLSTDLLNNSRKEDLKTSLWNRKKINQIRQIKIKKGKLTWP